MALQELVGAIASGSALRGPLAVSAPFDAFNLDPDLRYIGEKSLWWRSARASTRSPRTRNGWRPPC
jgi:hypothetical protein